MKGFPRVRSFGLAVILVAAAQMGHAATFAYDESIDGDGGNSFGAPTNVGTIGPGDLINIDGTVGGADLLDFFFFTSSVPADVILTGLTLTGSNTSTGFPVFDSGRDLHTGFGSDGTGLPESIVSGLAPGSYFVRPAEDSPFVSTYSLRIASVAAEVPLPASAILLLAGLGALGIARRRS